MIDYKKSIATMADGITSTDNLPPYFGTDYLIVLSLSDVDDRNNDDVGELSD